jgi:hypothetical protein
MEVERVQLVRVDQLFSGDTHFMPHGSMAVGKL